MTKNIKGRNGGDRATPKTTCSRNHISIFTRIKSLIVLIAPWGVLPVNLAEWIINRLHLENN